MIAWSSAEAEYGGMTHGICKLLWVKNILQDLEIDYEKPMSLHCDNKAAIKITCNLVQHDHTKHVKVNYHFIKKKS